MANLKRTLRRLGEMLGVIEVNPAILRMRREIKEIGEHTERMEFASGYEKLAKLSEKLGDAYTGKNSHYKAAKQYGRAEEIYREHLDMKQEADRVRKKSERLRNITGLETTLNCLIISAFIISLIFSSLQITGYSTFNASSINYQFLGICFFLLALVLLILRSKI